MALLEVKDLHTSFFTDAGEVKAVNGVSYSLDRGKVLGIVGESGSGKSVSAYSIMQILAGTGKIVSGSIKLDGQELVGAGEEVMKKVRGNKNLLKCFADIYAETAQDPETGVVEIDYSGVSNISNTAFIRVQELKELLEQRFPEAKIRIERTAPSVGCHVGPDEMSMFFLQKEVRPDILS